MLISCDFFPKPSTNLIETWNMGAYFYYVSIKGGGGSMNCLRRNSNEISCLKLNLNPKN